MKPIIAALALALASSVVSVAAFAAEPAAAPAAGGVETKFKTNACIACHSPSAKLVGPAYKDVAAKYRDKKDAEQMLFDKVRKGGSGVWGPVVMPPNSTASDEDLHAMIKWILAIK
jgi:cytochrome c